MTILKNFFLSCALVVTSLQAADSYIGKPPPRKINGYRPVLFGSLASDKGVEIHCSGEECILLLVDFPRRGARGKVYPAVLDEKRFRAPRKQESADRAACSYEGINRGHGVFFLLFPLEPQLASSKYLANIQIAYHLDITRGKITEVTPEKIRCLKPERVSLLR